MNKEITIKMDNTDMTQFLTLNNLYMEMCVMLREYNEMQMIQLERIKRIKYAAETLADWKFKFKDWYKELEPEAKKFIDKNKRW